MKYRESDQAIQVAQPIQGPTHAGIPSEQKVSLGSLVSGIANNGARKTPPVVVHPLNSMPSLEHRLRSLSKDLFRALRAGLAEALAHEGGTHRLRPVMLTSELGLDKSLASRIAKSLRENDELKALHAVPTPKGLQLVERALREKGVSEEALESFATAVDAYREILTEFSGGRTGLEATLAGWIPEQRASAERDARRLIFRGLTTVEGTRTGTIYNSLYVLPSEADPTKFDLLIVAVREDLRRLRADEEIPLTTITGYSRSGDWHDHRSLLSGGEIDGSADSETDPRSLVIDELCSKPAPQLELLNRGDSSVVVVSSASLDVNEIATVAFGWRMKDYFSRLQADEDASPHFSFTASVPAECMAVDIFVHQDLALRDDVVAALTRVIDVDHGAMSKPPGADSRERMRAPEVRRLANSTSALNTEDLRGCEAIARHVTQLAGVEITEFNAHRMRVEFPMTTEVLTVWVPLERGD